MEQMKPCPFCGSLSWTLGDHAGNCYLKLMANAVLVFKGLEPEKEYTNEQMREAWNTRTYSGDETAAYFILPKPKENIINEYSAIQCDKNGKTHGEYGFEIVQDALYRWQDQIDIEIKQKLFEAFRPTAELETMRGVVQTSYYRCKRCGMLIPGYFDSVGTFRPRFCSACGAKVVKYEH